MNDNYCLILGSNSELGQAVAYEFAKNNFNIFLAARCIDMYQKNLSADINKKYNVIVENVFFDGSNYKEHNFFYQRLPVKPLVVVSVFGYLGKQEIAEKEFDECYKIFDSNFIGHVSILNIIAADISKSGKGCIIGVSSVAGIRGRRSNYLYGCAKAAFIQYLGGLRARMYYSGVHVVTVVPGFIKTKMIEGIKTPEKLTATPQKVASAIWNAYVKKKNTVYVLNIWRLIMFFIKIIPEHIFKKMNL